MPDVEAVALRQNARRGAWRRRMVRSWAFSPRACPVGAIAIAVLVWFTACAPAEEPGATPAPAPLAGPRPATIVEPSAGPIPLAPSMTGTVAPALPPAQSPAPPPEPAPAIAMPEPPPPAPSPCPPGQIATWSKPDMAGTPVVLCRPLNPGR
ncbi:MAG TPA: hypothetical protein VGS13_07945 [Stellaceae bacterium]|nr:hypothetical protein [Stellaceae bacterium]